MATYNVQIEDSAGNKYHPKPDLLATKEQVSANTAAGKSVDALVVKELNNKLNNQPEWIRGESGNITGYRFGGADTVFPFSNAKAGSFVSAMGEEHTIGLGFEPSFIFVYETQSGGTGMLTHWLYFSEYSATNIFIIIPLQTLIGARILEQLEHTADFSALATM